MEQYLVTRVFAIFSGRFSGQSNDSNQPNPILGSINNIQSGEYEIEEIETVEIEVRTESKPFSFPAEKGSRPVLTYGPYDMAQYDMI